MRVKSAHCSVGGREEVSRPVALEHRLDNGRPVRPPIGCGGFRKYAIWFCIRQLRPAYPARIRPRASGHRAIVLALNPSMPLPVYDLRSQPSFGQGVPEPLEYRGLLRLMVKRELSVRYNRRAWGFVDAPTDPHHRVMGSSLVSFGKGDSKPPVGNPTCYLLEGRLFMTFFSRAFWRRSAIPVQPHPHQGYCAEFFLRHRLRRRLPNFLIRLSLLTCTARGGSAGPYCSRQPGVSDARSGEGRDAGGRRPQAAVTTSSS